MPRSRRSDPDAIVISPGPSRPENAGISVELVQRLGPSVPILGVCLGHQAIGVAYGAQVMRVPPVHGKARPVHHSGRGSFEGLPSPIDAARYHSLAVSTVALPDELEVTAWSEDGVIMGHPPSVASGGGLPVPPRVDPDRRWRGTPCRLPASRRRGAVRLMPEPTTTAIRLRFADAPSALADIVAAIADAGGTLRTLSTPRVADDIAEAELEVAGLDAQALAEALANVPAIQAHEVTRTLEGVFGKRVIVVGGGAQVAQVALGAVSEADRHNLRGERISVDTIALVGEENIAAAVRAVADLPRARCLVLAGSIMGGDITAAVRELREHGVPVIALNMAGSVTDAADLVVSDPVQAGTMAVMAIADTAQFDLARLRGRRY